jgi:hypothetical protein
MSINLEYQTATVYTLYMATKTPQQRSEAARKASATRRANRAAGIGPNPSRKRTRGGPAFTTPKPTAQGLKLVALSALEDVFVVKLRDTGISPDARKAYETYKKLLALALGPVSSTAMQNEADAALRMATIALVKLAF